MRNEALVQKLIERIDRIQQYCIGSSYESFEADTKLAEACVFNLSQIGEYAARIEEDYKTDHADIPWSQLRGLHNRIVHDYDGVNLLLVWEIIRDDLVILREQLFHLLP